MGTYLQGFELFIQNQGIVHRAVQVVGVPMWHQDYEEYFAEGRLLYAHYCERYYDGLETSAELEKFNKLAFNYIMRSLQRMRAKQWRSELQQSSLENLLTVEEEPQAIGDVEQDIVAINECRDFLCGLSARERQVLLLALSGYKSNRAIAKAMGISQSYVGKLRRLIRIKYLKLGGNADGKLH
jgi:RNA polymerase sigma factor (sigma-70 family)